MNHSDKLGSASEGITVWSAGLWRPIELPVVHLDEVIYFSYSLVTWFRESGVRFPDDFKWLKDPTAWFRLIHECDNHERVQTLDATMESKETKERFLFPLWLADDVLVDFFARIDRLTPVIHSSIHNYAKYSRVCLTAYESVDNHMPFSILLPQWKPVAAGVSVNNEPPLHVWLDQLYVSSDEFKPHRDKSKVALAQMFALLYPEMSKYYPMCSPRAEYTVKAQATERIATMSTMAFAQLCVYFYVVDKRMLIWLFQHVVHCDAGGYQAQLMDNFGWMETCPEMWTYFQLAAIVEDDPILLDTIHNRLRDWRLGCNGTLFEGRSIRPPPAKVSAALNRSHSDSELEFDLLTTWGIHRPFNEAKISKSTPPSARAQRTGHQYPFTGMAQYAKLLYSALRLESQSCFAFLKSEYIHFFTALLDSDTTLDKIDADLPPRTLLELVSM